MLTITDQCKEFRKDGWPFCPVCGEDELYSLSNPGSIETIVGCYKCNWKPVETDFQKLLEHVSWMLVMRQAKKNVQHIVDAEKAAKPTAEQMNMILD